MATEDQGELIVTAARSPAIDAHGASGGGDTGGTGSDWEQTTTNLTAVEITSISYNASTKIVSIGTKVTFNGYAAGYEYTRFYGWRYYYGNSTFTNFLWSGTSSSTITATGEISFTGTANLNVAFLACGGTFEFFFKVGNLYDSATVFIDAAFSIPASNFRISEYPSIHDQYVYYDGYYCGETGNCTSQAISTAKEIHELRSGKSNCKYSVSYLYGATAEQEGFTYNATALNFIKNTGIAPYWCFQDHVNRYPDNRFYGDYVINSTTIPGARSFYNKHTNTNYTLPQKIANWSVLADNVDNWNWSSVFQAIQESTGSGSSVVLAALGIDGAFDALWSGSGYMGDLKENFRDNHMVVILGWKVYNDRYYWIAQNSWGDDYGDNGIVYIPFTNNFGYDRAEGATIGIWAFYKLVDDSSAPAYPSLPSDWSWTSQISQGGAVTMVDNGDGTYKTKYLTAAEWNNFCTRINAYREYMALPGYSFTTVVTGNRMLASQANEARTAIAAMYPGTSPPAAVTAGRGITADFILGLSNALNSIT
jgi:hypothetical protein